jgi:hypothetical protein
MLAAGKKARMLIYHTGKQAPSPAGNLLVLWNFVSSSSSNRMLP